MSYFDDDFGFGDEFDEFSAEDLKLLDEVTACVKDVDISELEEMEAAENFKVEEISEPEVNEISEPDIEEVIEPEVQEISKPVVELAVVEVEKEDSGQLCLVF